MFQTNVASISHGCCKVDLDVAMLHMFYELQVFFIFMRDLNVPCNMKHILWWVFPHHQRMANNFLQHFLDVANGDYSCYIRLFYMLQTLFFDIATDQWSAQWEFFRQTSGY